MSFNIGLSGINAAQKDLDTTANNISNVRTTGFKQSRAEFADVYASSIFSSGNAKVGDGALTATVAQQFSQGTLEFTDNSLDMAISGNGFFATTSELGSQDFTYTRSGAFKLNNESFIVDNQNNFLLGFPVDRDSGALQSTSLATASPIQIPDSAGAPASTNNLYQSFNLDSRAPGVLVDEPGATPPITGNKFDPEDPTSYTSSTSSTIYDSLGESHVVTTYYVKRDSEQASIAGNTWDVYTTVDNQAVDLGATGTGAEAGVNAPDGTPAQGYRIQFDDSGNPLGPIDTDTGSTFAEQSISLNGVLSNGADPTQQVNVFFRDRNDEEGDTAPTQFASDFEVNLLEQDGSTVGRLTNLDIGEDGLIQASYSNGEVQYLGQVSLTRFANEQGLRQVGNTSWKETRDSGEALAGAANSGTFGAIESSALENSNVDLTKELVDLIAAQRNFQANSRSLEVNNTLNQTVLQIR
ncbi:flagellar hook protein FlgE [Idiomarina seosinensis]|uniref:Flagellar hook protein FlgE n=1 Tax=Idiomarina seosinensis TaxID=281739 RepID=A0A432ZGG0_9GAMM|nr:flagellar hook protein FlgE [Idiomarina seosinensis]RUO77031.1 flagellar hook protein FlgE [Idiomarina seosinensis]